MLLISSAAGEHMGRKKRCQKTKAAYIFLEVPTSIQILILFSCLYGESYMVPKFEKIELLHSV